MIRRRVTKADLAALGLSGGADSAARRKALQKKLALPENLSANALLDAVNSLYTRDEFLSAARSFEHEGRGIAEQEKAAGGGLKLGGEPVESIGASSPICKRRITEQKSIAQLTQSVPRTMPKASSLSGEKRRFIKSPLPLYPRSALRRNGQHMETVDFSAFL